MYDKADQLIANQPVINKPVTRKFNLVERNVTNVLAVKEFWLHFDIDIALAEIMLPDYKLLSQDRQINRKTYGFLINLHKSLLSECIKNHRIATS